MDTVEPKNIPYVCNENPNPQLGGINSQQLRGVVPSFFARHSLAFELCLGKI